MCVNPCPHLRLHHLLAACLITILAGCSTTSRYTLDTEFDSAPVKTRSKLSEALQCFSHALEGNRQNPSAFAFMVRDISDGTINKNTYTDGPLADAGRLQITSILTAYTKPSYGVVLDEFPFMLKSVINESVGLNRFGLPSQENLNALTSHFTQFVNMNRSNDGLPLINAIVPLIIDGAFTRYDSSHTRSKGYGENAGYRGDIENEQSASVDFGDSASERSITLVVNVIDPRNNVVVGTESFDLKFYSNSKTARFRVAIDDYYYGFSNTDVRVETVHAAQQTLLEASAIWILDNAYGGVVDFSPCFDTKEKLALGRDSRMAHTPAIALSAEPQTTPADAAPVANEDAEEEAVREAAVREQAAQEETTASTADESKGVTAAAEFPDAVAEEETPALEPEEDAVTIAEELQEVIAEEETSALALEEDALTAAAALQEAIAKEETLALVLAEDAPTTAQDFQDPAAGSELSERAPAAGQERVEVGYEPRGKDSWCRGETGYTTNWCVSAGFFCIHANAVMLVHRLNANGFTALQSEPLSTPACESKLVWLGPFADETTAQIVSARLAEFTGENGYVTNDD